MRALLTSIPLSLVCLLAGCDQPADAPAAGNPAASERLPQQGSEAAADPAVFEHDFGRVLAGAQPEYIFLFTNESQEVLTLDEADINRSCGCSSAQVASHELQPGDSTEITLRVATAGKENLFTESVDITWKGSSIQHAQRFILSGDAIAGLSFSPRTLQINAENIGEDLTIVMSSECRLDWDSVRFDTTHDAVECRLLEAASDGKGSLAVRVVNAKVADFSRIAPIVRIRAVCEDPDNGEQIDLIGRFLLMVDLTNYARLASTRTILTESGSSCHGALFVKGAGISEDSTVLVHSDQVEDFHLSAYSISRISPTLHRINFEFDTKLCNETSLEVDFTVGTYKLSTVRLIHP